MTSDHPVFHTHSIVRGSYPVVLDGSDRSALKWLLSV
jgi:hypothetical protein